MSWIRVIQIELTNGEKYDHMNVNRLMVASKLQSYREQCEKVISKRIGKPIQVSVIYTHYKADTAEIMEFYHDRERPNHD